MAESAGHGFPKKRVAAGALFFDEGGRLLVVKPTYLERWGIPGGVVEAGESPRDGCAREVLEELGLEVTPGRLVAVDYTSADARTDDSLQFLFDGGVLGPAAIASIRLPPEELTGYRFAPRVQAIALLGGGRLARRMPAALRAYDEGRTVYLQDGREA
jgi:8-oxo-dGTP pyrophosphatase MutT (NUDIX family)